MSEPRLEDIEDYTTLKGEKKKVVIAVIFAGLIMGLVYTIASSVYDNRENTIEIKESIDKLPNSIANKKFN